MNRIVSIRSLITVLGMLFSSAWVQAAVPPAEKLLPDDTLFMATAPDCARLRELSQQSPMSQLWNDPAMKPIRDKFLARVQEELVGPLERELGVKLSDYAALAQGQFTVAVTANGWQGRKGEAPGVLLLLDARDKQADLEKALAEFRKKWTDAGKPLRTGKVRDVEFLVVTLTTNDVPAALKRLLPGPSGVRELKPEDEEEDSDSASAKVEAEKTEIILVRVDSLLIMGSTLKAVERLVGPLTGSSAPVLADVAEFQPCQNRFFREANMYAWLNARALIGPLTHMSEKEEQSDEVAPDPFASIKPGKILDAVGLSGLRNGAIAYQDSPEGPMVQFHLGVPEAERKGLLKILVGESKDATPPPFVPADVIKFTRWRMDGQKTWAALTSTMDDISPGIMGTVNFILNTAEAAGKQKDENFDLHRQVIGNLGDDIISFEKKPRGTTVAELGQPPTITMIAAKNADEMVAALKIMLTALSPGGQPAGEREFLGRKIYTVTSLARPQMDPTNLKPEKMHLSSSGGYVLIASDETVLEEYLRSGESQPKALRDEPGLLEASSKVTGSGTSLFIYENQVESQRAGFELLRQVMGADTNASVSGMTPVPEAFGMAMPQESVKAWFDFSLLPPFEVLAKYFHFSVMGGGADVDGLTLKVFSPTPPGLKK